MPILAELADAAGTAAGSLVGALEALLDAIAKEDDRIAGRAVTRLTAALTAGETDAIDVESTIGFGQSTDGDPAGLLLVNGEVIAYAARNNNTPFQFQTLTRGLQNTDVVAHPEGSLVLDLAANTSAVDHVRRGLLVDTAVGEDLDIIARNLGLESCPGITEDQLRRIIRGVAYLPKATPQAYAAALEALYGDTTSWRVIERTDAPWRVLVELIAELSTDVRGRFLLNGGEIALTTGLNTVDVVHTPSAVLGVYAATPGAKRGSRTGTEFFGAGSFLGTTITLASSPGPIGTEVVVDYSAFGAHYLAADETVRDDADRYAYLADAFQAAQCLLEQVRAAGVRVEFKAVSP